MDLFDNGLEGRLEKEAPLAARMRPRTFDEFVGQKEIVGEGRLLRRAIQADRLLTSVILWGPPGTGKTTLATIIANSTKSHFISISAVLAGIGDLRKEIAEAKERRKYYGTRTTLFVDEVHRWNKAQQDALLPHVEDGTVVLVGATTENPHFEVIGALVSRSRIFQLQSLGDDEVRTVLTRAMKDPDRGYGKRNVRLDEDALSHLIGVSGGDVRNALNALELAIESTPPDDAGLVRVDLGVAQESIQRRAVLYDKDGDAHYDTISAFIKSIRGSDPDAALFWLAKMLYAGESPRFILRRLLILAGEDVGLADPFALVVTNAAAQAFEVVGLPEGVYSLAQATIYLATAPKSNGVGAFFKAYREVEECGKTDVPTHLKDPARDRKSLGHGEGYVYPHSHGGHHVGQQYLPDALLGMTFYEPSDEGFEGAVKERLARWRAVQQKALGILEARDAPEISDEVRSAIKRKIQRHGR